MFTGQHSPVPLDRKITDVISTIEKVSSIYKMKHSKPAADSSQASALTELEKKCREFVELAEKTNKVGFSNEVSLTFSFSFSFAF